MRDNKDWRGDYTGMFNAFFKNAVLASTYKPYFVAALVDVSVGGVGEAQRHAWNKWTCREGGRIRVDLNLVAALFARLYWDITASMDPKHTPPRMADPDNYDRDISIVRLIKAEVEKRKREETAHGTAANIGKDLAGAPEEPSDRGGHASVSGAPPPLDELVSDGMAEFRKKVIAMSIKPEVLRHLPMDMRGLYEICGSKDAIVFNAEAITYMRRNDVAIRAALGRMIARCLEKNNRWPDTPQPWWA